MEEGKAEGIIEAILFAGGREVRLNELMSGLELCSDEFINAVAQLSLKYE